MNDKELYKHLDEIINAKLINDEVTLKVVVNTLAQLMADWVGLLVEEE